MGGNKLAAGFHHFWSRCLLGFAIIIVLAAVILSIIRVATPLVSGQRHHVEAWLSDFLHYPITIDKISAGWNGFEPIIRFIDTTFYSPELEKPLLEMPLLKIKSFSIGINLWQSLMHWNIQYDRIGISGAKLIIQSQKDGKIVISSMGLHPLIVIDSNKNTQNNFFDGFSNIKKIDISNVDIDWQRYDGVILPIHNIKMELQKQALSNGWMISGNKLQVTYDGEPSPETNFYLRMENGKYQFFLDKLPLELLGKSFQSIDLASTSKQMQQLNLSGSLTGFYLQYKNINDFSAMGELEDLTLSDQKNAVKNLHAKFYVFPKVGEFDLNSYVNSAQVEIRDPELIKHAIIIKHISGKIFWKQMANGWNIITPQLNLISNNGIMNVTANILVPYADIENPFLNISLNLNNFNLTKVKNNLPVSLDKDKDLKKWLSNAFVKGMISNVKITIQGYAKDLPFNNGHGIFTGEAILNDLTLNYEKDWPWMYGVNGKVLFNNGTMTINATHGYLLKNQFLNATAVINNIGSKEKSNLIVDSTVIGSLENTKQFLIKSPLYKDVGRHLLGLDLHGAMRMHLKLNIPLDKNDHDNKADGVIYTSDANLAIPKWGIDFNNIKGALQFSNQHFFAKGIKAQFLQQPIIVNIASLVKRTLPSNSVTKNITQIAILGKLNLDKLKQDYSNGVLKKINGAMSYHAELQIPEKSSNTLTMTSNLMGLTSDYPAPFAKTKLQSWPSSITLNFEDKQPMAVTLKLNNNIKAKLTFNSDKKLIFTSGNLHFGPGEASYQEQAGLYIDGILPIFNLADWQDLLENNNSVNTDYKFFRYTKLTIKNLNIYDHLFQNTEVRINPLKEQWQVLFGSNNMVGSITVPIQQHKTLTANFSKLYLVNSAKGKKVEKVGATGRSPGYKNPQNISPLNLRIDDFRYHQMELGKINLITSHTNLGLKIDKLTVESKVFKFSAAGQWQQIHDRQQTDLKGKFAAKTIADIMKLFSYPTTIQAKNFQTNFKLSWEDAPYNFSVKTLSGSVKLVTGRGQIVNLGKNTEQTIATGEILSLLSLQSLQRRLEFNFSDLTNKGFNFDSIQGDFLLNNGGAITKNAKINGIIAQINIVGQIGIKLKNFNLNLEVIPYLTGSLPIIATIAGGPVIGAATWVADKLVAPEINKMSARYFKLSGSWRNPVVTKTQKL